MKQPPKPDHLGPEYGGQFQDPSVAGAYEHRPPYPDEVFDILAGLCPPESALPLLDLGCGTGDLTLGLAARYDRVDAVDASAEMIARGRLREGAERPGLRWFVSRAEDFEGPGPYGLVTAAQSFHWFDWPRVTPRVASMLAPGAVLALIGGRMTFEVPWAEPLLDAIRRHSTNRLYRPYKLIDELTERGLFALEGRASTRPLPFTQSVEAYIESFHSRNGFSRDRMAPESAAEFDEAVRGLLAPWAEDGRVRFDLVAEVIWGRPTP